MAPACTHSIHKYGTQKELGGGAGQCGVFVPLRTGVTSTSCHVTQASHRSSPCLSFLTPKMGVTPERVPKVGRGLTQTTMGSLWPRGRHGARALKSQAALSLSRCASGPGSQAPGGLPWHRACCPESCSARSHVSGSVPSAWDGDRVQVLWGRRWGPPGLQDPPLSSPVPASHRTALWGQCHAAKCPSTPGPEASEKTLQ